MKKTYLVNDKEVTQEEYLYGVGCKPMKIPDEVILDRVTKLQTLLEELLNHSYYIRDSMRIHRILKAIKLWENINE